jgi:hypothetical protein
MNASVAPIINLIANKIILFVEIEKIKHETQFNNKIKEQTFLGPNREKIIPTNTLAQAKPK